MKWNYEICAAIAAKFAGKQEFREHEGGAFQWLRRNGLLERACAHMTPAYRSFSNDDLARIASQYSTRRAFKVGDQSAYKASIKRGILDDVCAHMSAVRRALSNDEIADIAKRFASRSEFVRNDSGAYQSAVNRGILDAVCAHMEGGRQTRRLSDEEIIAIAGKYSTRNDFKLGDFGAYTTAIRRGLMDGCCAHMECGASGFREDKAAVLYQFRLGLPDGQILYKVGITNRKPKQRAITMGIKRGVKVELTHAVRFVSGRDARMAERCLHRRFADKRYVGAPVMVNGNTEVFTIGLLGA